MNCLAGQVLPVVIGSREVTESVSLYFTDFTLTVMEAAPLVVRRDLSGATECMMLLLSGAGQVSSNGNKAELHGYENGVFFGGSQHSEGHTMTLRDATAVFCSFPGGISSALERWGVYGLNVAPGTLGSSLLNNAAAHFFHDLVLSHSGESSTPPISAGPVFDAARGMLVALVQANLQGPTAEPRLGTRELALAMVQECGLDPELNVAIIAKRLHLSLRQLQRSFADGETLSMVLSQHRASHAGELLRHSDSGDMTLACIAKLSGFSGTKTLRRALAEVFGKSPQQLRDAM